MFKTSIITSCITAALNCGTPSHIKSEFTTIAEEIQKASDTPMQKIEQVKATHLHKKEVEKKSETSQQSYCKK